MGNGQSGSDINIPLSNSFLSTKKSVPKTKGKVIVVKERTLDQSCSKNDDIIKRFMGIPKFYPILKSALNQPGLRDLSETIFKINARTLLRFSYRLQEHLSQCASTVAVEQELLGDAMKDVDHNISLLLMHFDDRKKSMDRFQNYLEKINDLQAHITNLRFLFEDLIPITENLNEILPEQRRLSVLNIGRFISAIKDASERRRSETVQALESGTYAVENNEANLHIKPVDEVAVVDKNII
uniref:BLOC-1-related complex subunit 5 n=1 Tax=Setaria digitata TaxID=48799 RepID=A0A915PFA4_9BILA